VHSTAQYPFEDVVAQRKLCGQGAASHGMVGVRAPECSPAAALHSRGVERQHWEAEAMAEGSLYFDVEYTFFLGKPKTGRINAVKWHFALYGDHLYDYTVSGLRKWLFIRLYDASRRAAA
jgi:hypothetical protein